MVDGHVDQPGRPEAVVGVHVPLVAERADTWPERDATGRPTGSATAVFRQNRSLLYCAGTVMSVVPELTMKSCPVSAFCGRPPSAGGLNRGSCQVPVQVGGSCGSTGRVVVRLLVGHQRAVRRVRCRRCSAPSRVFQNTSLPLKNARFTPASRAASTFARCCARPVLVVADRHEDLVVGRAATPPASCRRRGR